MNEPFLISLRGFTAMVLRGRAIYLTAHYRINRDHNGFTTGSRQSPGDILLHTHRINAVLFLAACSLAAAEHPVLPNPRLTPGATDPAVTQATVQNTICRHGYTKTVRNVGEAEKKEVMARYGLPESQLAKVEIDHFISLEIGGSNDAANLWPEYYDPAKGQIGYLGARDKDVVETAFHRAICNGTMTLSQAQQRIREWPEEYRKLKSQ